MLITNIILYKEKKKNSSQIIQQIKKNIYVVKYGVVNTISFFSNDFHELYF